MSERQAGRELDAEIAEKVMGCRVVRQSGNSPWLVETPAGIWGRVEQVPYSTDIAAAWQVVEKYRVLDHHFNVGVNMGFDGKAHGYWAICANGPTAHADTAPLAICLAALAAVADPSGDEKP